jgi:streptogramin lyase
MYMVPTTGSYPQGLSIDDKGMVWFSEIFGKRIGVLDPSKVIDNTTRGITEFALEDIEFETLGPGLIRNSYNNTIWFTAVTYPEGGNVVGFDVINKNFTVFDLPEGTGVPVGIAEDEDGVLWINDHATNLFFRFDPKTSIVKKIRPLLLQVEMTLPLFHTGILLRVTRSGSMNMKEMPWHISIEQILLLWNFRFLRKGYRGEIHLTP